MWSYSPEFLYAFPYTVTSPKVLVPYDSCLFLLLKYIPDTIILFKYVTQYIFLFLLCPWRDLSFQTRPWTDSIIYTQPLAYLCFFKHDPWLAQLFTHGSWRTDILTHITYSFYCYAYTSNCYYCSITSPCLFSYYSTTPFWFTSLNKCVEVNLFLETRHNVKKTIEYTCISIIQLRIICQPLCRCPSNPPWQKLLEIPSPCLSSQWRKRRRWRRQRSYLQR